MDVILPGGLACEGSIERRARFRELTGRIEQALLESDPRDGWAFYVTRLLSRTLETIGGEPADEERVSSLCMADRHYLMLRLAATLHGERMWLKVDCESCKAPFDVEVQRCDLPVKAAGPGYPLASVECGGSRFCVRVPTGEDQAHIEQLDDEDKAMHALLERCIVSVDDADPDQGIGGRLSEEAVDAIDDALDALSPAVCGELLVECPECGCEQQAQLNHYLLGDLGERLFYDEVHSLAMHYHWSESDILDLPLRRRRLYLDLISRVPAHGEGGSAI